MMVSIAQIAAQDRPRERLDRLGPRALTDSELVALVVRSGGSGCSALTLAQELLAHYGGLGALAEGELHELAAGRAMGPAKAASLVAAFELGRRAADRTESSTTRIRDAADLAAVARRSVIDPAREESFVVVLSAANRVLRVEPLTTGTDSRCLLESRDVLAAVLRYGGAAFALVHTHPSGETRPSRQDRATTEELGRAAEVVGLAMIDHIILAGTRWCSVLK
ncbi:MAG: JAB domain-containing protein [Actinomycetota bacterium]